MLDNGAGNQIATGRFAQALETLKLALPLVPQDPEFNSLRIELEKDRDQVNDLKRFYELAETAWFMASDDEPHQHEGDQEKVGKPWNALGY